MEEEGFTEREGGLSASPSPGESLEDELSRVEAEIDSISWKLKRIVGSCRLHKISLGMVAYSGCVEKCWDCRHYRTLRLSGDPEEIVDRAYRLAAQLEELRERKEILLLKMEEERRAGGRGGDEEEREPSTERVEDRFDWEKFHLRGGRHECTGRIASVREGIIHMVLGLEEAAVGGESFNLIYLLVTKATYNKYSEYLREGRRISFRATAYIDTYSRPPSLALKAFSTLRVEGDDGRFVRPQLPPETLRRMREERERKRREKRERLLRRAEKWLGYVEERIQSGPQPLYGRGIAIASRLMEKADGDRRLQLKMEQLIASWLSGPAPLQLLTVPQLRRLLAGRARARDRKQDLLEKVEIDWDRETAKQIIEEARRIFTPVWSPYQHTSFPFLTPYIRPPRWVEREKARQTLEWYRRLREILPVKPKQQQTRER